MAHSMSGAELTIKLLERQGVSRISEPQKSGDKVTPFPMPIYTPGSSGD